MWAVIRFCTYMADLTLVVSRTSRVGEPSHSCLSRFLNCKQASPALVLGTQLTCLFLKHQWC